MAAAAFESVRACRDAVRTGDRSAVALCEAALASIDACLRHAGAQAKHVVKVTIFMTDISERPLINPLRIEYFGENRPASTLVEVRQLVDPRLRVEIEAVAYVNG